MLEAAHVWPQAWKTLALETHPSFDAVAQGIANQKSTERLMGRFATVLQNCAGCHAMYRLNEAP